jgi:ABC-2 type transport system ATP-binding protein
MEDVAIKVEGLSKTFKLPHEKQSSVKGLLINLKKSKSYEKQQVLDDISFEIQKGEFFGIVGRNGSGKSTLLKTLAGIYAPTNGNVKINGSLVPFIELGVGFNPELTGRENVFLNGALLGFNRKQMLNMYKDIVDFAELKKFMDQKLKNYSSGMQVRLAFSIAIRARGDILLLDEVLAVGDSAFQQKCYDYFNSLKRDKRTIILVSHNMQVIERFCDRALMLDRGIIKKIGTSTEIANMYEDMFIREEAQRIREERNKPQAQADYSHESIKILSVKILQDSKPTKQIKAKKDYTISVTLESKEDLEKINIGINIKNRDKLMLISTDTLSQIGDIKLQANTKKTVTFKIENILTNGLYMVNIGIADASGSAPHIIIIIKENAEEFIVSGIKEHTKSLTHPKIKVSI